MEEFISNPMLCPYSSPFHPDFKEEFTSVILGDNELSEELSKRDKTVYSKSSDLSKNNIDLLRPKRIFEEKEGSLIPKLPRIFEQPNYSLLNLQTWDIFDSLITNNDSKFTQKEEISERFSTRKDSDLLEKYKNMKIISNSEYIEINPLHPDLPRRQNYSTSISIISRSSMRIGKEDERKRVQKLLIYSPKISDLF